MVTTSFGGIGGGVGSGEGGGMASSLLWPDGCEVARKVGVAAEQLSSSCVPWWLRRGMAVQSMAEA